MASRSSHFLLQVAILQVALKLSSIYNTASANPVERCLYSSVPNQLTHLYDRLYDRYDEPEDVTRGKCLALCLAETEFECAGCHFQPVQPPQQTLQNSGVLDGLMAGLRDESGLCAIFAKPANVTEQEIAAAVADVLKVHQTKKKKTISKRSTRPHRDVAPNLKTLRPHRDVRPDYKRLASGETWIINGRKVETPRKRSHKQLASDGRTVETQALLESDAALVVKGGRLAADAAPLKEEELAARKARMAPPFPDEGQAAAQKQAEAGEVARQRLRGTAHAYKAVKEMAAGEIAETKIQVDDGLSSSPKIKEATKALAAYAQERMR